MIPISSSMYGGEHEGIPNAEQPMGTWLRPAPIRDLRRQPLVAVDHLWIHQRFVVVEAEPGSPDQGINMKFSHLKTPRTMREAWGEDTRLNDKENTIGDWIVALCIGALIGLMLGLGMR